MVLSSLAILASSISESLTQPFLHEQLIHLIPPSSLPPPSSPVTLHIYPINNFPTIISSAFKLHLHLSLIVVLIILSILFIPHMFLKHIFSSPVHLMTTLQSHIPRLVSLPFHITPVLLLWI